MDDFQEFGKTFCGVPKSINEPNSVNHPEHYNAYPREVIDMMIDIWGKEKVAVFCEINAFKYRMRAGLKDDIHEDLSKELWYLTKAKELRDV